MIRRYSSLISRVNLHMTNEY